MPVLSAMLLILSFQFNRSAFLQYITR